MDGFPSPTSRSGRRLGVRRQGGSSVMRALVRRLIARAMALGRPGLGSRTRELAGDVPRARSSVPSHARPTLADMDLTPHLTRLPAPTAGAPRAGLVHRLRARLTGPSRGRLAGSPWARLAGSSRARLARACDPLHRTTAAPGAHNSPAKPTSPPPIPLLESQTHWINRTIPCNPNFIYINLYIKDTKYATPHPCSRTV